MEIYNGFLKYPPVPVNRIAQSFSLHPVEWTRTTNQAKNELFSKS
jgi:hypothetical protein